MTDAPAAAPFRSASSAAKPVISTAASGSREANAMRIKWRGLELPTRVALDESVSTPMYGRFYVEPFERGFGNTVGNSLRRILLSSLEGAAVTHVRIKGVEHEFSTIPGVLEDVSQIILNIKSLVVKSTSDAPKTMRLSARGESGKTVEVRAGRIEADPAIEIVNPDHHLATLTDAATFEVEFTVGRGRGYATSEDHNPEGEDQIIGVIPVDSIYSPVQRVRYRVEDTRVGQRTNYDRLVMEIWTNGTLTPEMSLVEAAKILRKHLNPFVQYFELTSGLGVSSRDQEFRAMAGGGEAADPELLAKSISDLDLSVRASNCLLSANINTINDLIVMSESSLLKLRSFGKTSLREVKRKLAEYGLALRSDGGPEIDLSGEDEDEEEETEGLDESAGNSPYGGGFSSDSLGDGASRSYAPSPLGSTGADAAHRPGEGSLGGNP